MFDVVYDMLQLVLLHTDENDVTQSNNLFVIEHYVYALIDEVLVCVNVPDRSYDGDIRVVEKLSGYLFAELTTANDSYACRLDGVRQDVFGDGVLCDFTGQSSSG